MGRKVILDVDPGIDDAMALCLALSDPELEVVAVTAVGGNVSPAQATRNVQAIIERLDPPRWPRLGAASEPDNRLAVDRRGLYGSDGLGGTGFVVAERQHLLPSEKVICDQVRDAPHSVTIVALGPLTNIARAFIRDPDLPTLVGRVVIMGGTGEIWDAVSESGPLRKGARVRVARVEAMRLYVVPADRSPAEGS
jgi:inosine-uridine nucleoside N-ribohydrolase